VAEGSETVEMCVTPVVKCWHCGEWLVKKSNRESFEACPSCGKRFEQLSPDAQRAVKATLAPFFEVPRMKVEQIAAYVASIFELAKTQPFSICFTRRVGRTVTR